MAATSSPQATRQIDLFAELHEAPSGKRALSEPVADALVVPTPREGVKENVEALAQQLERTGRYRILRKLEPRPIRENYVLNPGERVGNMVDTETTGLDHRRNEIIELGMVAFTYDDGGIREVINVFSQLQEPSEPISSEVIRITGITDDMVAAVALIYRRSRHSSNRPIWSSRTMQNSTVLSANVLHQASTSNRGPVPYPR